MPKYLINVSQPASTVAKHIEDSIRMAGSHFATHARWRRTDNMAMGTFVVEADDRRWAIAVVPPCMRANARVDRLEPLHERPPFAAFDENPHYAIAA